MSGTDSPGPAQQSDRRGPRGKMFAVLGAGLFTFGAALLTRKSVMARNYVPRRFDANHIPPKFNMRTDAVYAMLNASLLAGSLFTFGIASVCLLLDVESIEEFNLAMKEKYGAQQREKDIAELVKDEDTSALLSSWRKKDTTPANAEARN